MFVFIDDSSRHKKAKGMSKNVVARLSHNKYKDNLLNQKRLRHSMIRDQSKIHRKGFYKISKTFFIVL